MAQCVDLKASLQKKLDGETDIAIMVSPMRRTIQTALVSLDWLIQNGVPITAHASWQGEHHMFHISDVTLTVSPHPSTCSLSTSPPLGE